VRLNEGTRIGRYEILERIGTGGMGEVYRARDTRLDKVVAIKIIASEYADDPEARPRFDRERKLTATLEHPHICHLLDAGHEGGITYFAMEYLKGEPLSDRLARGRIPPREALGYAIEIAEALSYAHSRGVIHRDLKPANVYLTATGVKLLDFGLAKLRPGRPAAGPAGDTAPLIKTTPGTLIGTALYMAPERLEGAEADERTDTFSFGLVLYEMLAGRPAFQGKSMASVIAAVMTAEPPPLPPSRDGNEELEWIVRKCLAKPLDERWQSMRDVATVLRRLAGRGAAARRARREPTARGALAAVAMLAVVVPASVGVWGRFSPAERAAARQVVFRVEPPADGGFRPTANSVQSPMLALSPDGSALAYVASGPDGPAQVWVRYFDDLQPRALRGTEDAMFPFWSPDGRSIGFFADGSLKRVDLTGGPARVLAAAPAPCGGAWSASGIILFAPRVDSGLLRVSEDGGEVVAATRPDSSLGHMSHRWPRFIGDGSQYVYFARSGDQETAGLYLASLDGGAAKLLMKSRFGGEYLPPDRILTVSDGSLLAQPFDRIAGRVSGDPVLLADGIATSTNHYPAFSVSATGALAYASVARASELTWFDRRGQRLSSVAGEGAFVDFRLSPDNRYVAVAEVDQRTGHPDLYLRDLERGTRDRLTSTRVSEGTPTWSPDGLELLFRSNRGTVHDLYRRAAFATEPERPFLQSEWAKYPTSWSRDGRTILFHSLSETTGWDIWAVSADEPGPAAPVIHTRLNEAQAQLSPDGRFVAYTAEENALFDVHLQRFTPGGRRWRISIAGGSDPRWNPDGSELFYVAADRWLMSVRMMGRGQIQPPAPQRLFKMPEVAVLPPYTSLYDVAADGGRFLVRVPREDLRTLPLTIVLNAGPSSGETAGRP
jgi:Tol biopolymer transport system component